MAYTGTDQGCGVPAVSMLHDLGVYGGCHNDIIMDGTEGVSVDSVSSRVESWSVC